MPRRSSLRLSVLADLASQARLANRAALRKQVDAAITLSAEVEPDRNYPEAWVVRRLTGYAPELDAPATVVGDALLGEISAYTERISEAAGVTVESLGDGALSIEGLSRAWSVTPRTLERWRRDGLVAVRARDARGAWVVRFVPEAVRAFARRWPSRAGAGPKLAQAARARGPSGPRGPTQQLRRVAWGASRRGVPVRDTAAGLGRTGASVRRLLNEYRAALLRVGAQDLAPLAGAPRVGAGCVALAVWGEVPVPAQTAGAFIAGASAAAAPDRHWERSVAAAHAGVCASAYALVAELPRDKPSALALDEIETLFRMALPLRLRLAHAQRGVALRAVEGRLGGSLLAAPASLVRTAHAAAMGSVLGAVGRFAPAGGRTLAGAVGPAVDRAMVQAVGAASMGGSSGRAQATGTALVDWTRLGPPWRRAVEPPAWLRRRLGGLAGPDRRAAAARWGLDGAPPLSVSAAAGQLGCAAGTVAQRTARALRCAYAADSAARDR